MAVVIKSEVPKEHLWEIVWGESRYTTSWVQTSTVPWTIV